jgi:hypothetical protein
VYLTKRLVHKWKLLGYIVARTTTGARQLSQSQGREIRGDLFKRNVCVPNLIVSLLGDHAVVILWRPVNRLVLLGADGADLKIVTAQVTLGIEQWVNVQTGCGRASGDLAELQDELLL